MTAVLCSDCVNGIWCETWGENKCMVNKRRIYSGDILGSKCKDYKKRGKDFKPRRCQCKDCLNNETLYEEED